MEFVKKNPIIILIAGKARSGKGTVSKYLEEEFLKLGYKVVCSPYTKYLKKYIEDITGECIEDDNKPRELLQKISSELIKKELDDSNFFIRRQIEDINFYSYFMDVILVDDVRFPEEIDLIRRSFSKVVAIGVERKNYVSTLTKEQQDDITEVALDDYSDFDYKILNTSELVLREKTLEIFYKISEDGRKMNKIIAIDGPAGSGKGTLAKRLSEELNLVNIDTGATYRCVALKCLRNNIELDDVDKIIEISSDIDIDLKQDGKVFLDEEDVTDAIRSKEVTQIVSPLSSIVEVRKNLVDIQRKIALGKDVVMEGRDITTVVFPDTKYKFYLDASLESRVERRFKENQEKGIDMTYDEVLENIQKRDYNDINKKVGALKRTDDQVYIDTTNLTVDEEVEIIKKVLEGDK